MRLTNAILRALVARTRHCSTPPRAAVGVMSVGMLQAWTNSNNNFRLNEAEGLAACSPAWWGTSVG